MATDLLTPTAMISRVREVRRVAIAAEAETFVLAAEWADAHPDPTEPSPCGSACADSCVHDPEGFSDPLIPAVAWHAAAPFGAAIGRTTGAGSAMMRDALIVRHRLPRLWQRVLTCEVEPWRARRIAQTVIGRPRDVSEWLDDQVTPVAHQIGVTTLDRLLDEALLRLYPEQRELDQLEALDARHATFHDQLTHGGVAEMTLRCDYKDLFDFDVTLGQVAAALAAADRAADREPESLDVRRSQAVGILADPAGALALLTGSPAPAPRKAMQLVCHITPGHLAGVDPVARNATALRAELEQQVRNWCGRTDTHVTVLPVIDPNGHVRSDAYEVRDRLKQHVDLVAGSCVFPWCTRPAHRCDHDHVVPYDEGGATCDCNIAPLCRHHHRIKTHAGWRYTPIEPGVWLWSEPHGQQFLRDGRGTLDVTPPGHTDRTDGCRGRSVDATTDVGMQRRPVDRPLL